MPGDGQKQKCRVRNARINNSISLTATCTPNSPVHKPDGYQSTDPINTVHRPIKYRYRSFLTLLLTFPLEQQVLFASSGFVCVLLVSSLPAKICIPSLRKQKEDTLFHCHLIGNVPVSTSRFRRNSRGFLLGKTVSCWTAILNVPVTRLGERRVGLPETRQQKQCNVTNEIPPFLRGKL